jgi:hypothetical protein
VRLALLVLILTGALAAAAPAGADVSVGFGGGVGAVLDPEGDNGWRVIVEHFADGSRTGFRVRQIGFGDPAIRSTQAGCTRNVVANDVVCEAVPTIVQIVQADDAANELAVGGSNVGCEPGPDVPVVLRMGGGNDIVRPLFGCGGQANVTGNNRLSPHFAGSGGSGNDSLTGGRLEDDLRGDDGNDTIAGDVGADTLAGGNGNDTITGQGGADTLEGGAGADFLDGGGQTDTVLYPVPNRVIVTLDDVANDGRAGEGDNVIDVETVVTGEGNDSVTGSSAAETLDGGAGDDTLRPGTGTDTVHGGAGDDTIDVREDSEGIRDTVTCGIGQDEVIADLKDVVAVRFITSTPKDDSACERVERFAVDDGPPGRIRTRSVKLGRDGLAALRLACPARARVTCRGTMRVADPRRLSRTLARGTYSVRRGATSRIRLRLSRAGARRARRRGAITVITRERGVSKKGPRSMTATLRVR